MTAGLELDVVLVEEAPGGGELLVEAAERRAAVAGDIAGGVVAGGQVALALQHRQAHQRLDAGQEDPALGLVYLSSRLTSASVTARTSRSGPAAVICPGATPSG